MAAADLVIIGAGAAGMFCAGVAAQRGAKVVLIDHATVPGEKIRISGGGRCNFTNLQADLPDRFVSSDMRFARDILRAYPPRRFIELVKRHGIDYHEKHRGQLFCDRSSQLIIDLLRQECDAGSVTWMNPCRVQAVRQEARAADNTLRLNRGARFVIETDAGPVHAAHLVIATGGLSIPKIGATDFGYRIAGQFGLKRSPTRPGLVPLTFDGAAWQPFAGLAGLALEVRLHTPAGTGTPCPHFEEDLLFTHRGLSGPAVLQVSNYWQPQGPLHIDLAGGRDLEGLLQEARRTSRQQLDTTLGTVLPKRLAGAWLAQSRWHEMASRRLAEIGNRTLQEMALALRNWQVTPTGTEGYRKAEVTLGGVHPDELDPRTLQAHRVPGLYFIGEVVDVTGWLGGYNFQWAWASGFAAANAVLAHLAPA